MDFKKATTLFSDPDFDGEPVVIYEPEDDDDPLPPDEGGDADDEDDEGDGTNGAEHKVYVGGLPVRIIAERVEYVGPDGQLITESYREFAKKQIETEFASLDDFVRKWNSAERKQVIIEELEQYGVILENLAAEVSKEFDPFD